MEQECWIGTTIRVVGSFALFMGFIYFFGERIVFTGFGLLLLWAYYDIYFT